MGPDVIFNTQGLQSSSYILKIKCENDVNYPQIRILNRETDITKWSQWKF